LIERYKHHLQYSSEKLKKEIRQLSRQIRLRKIERIWELEEERDILIKKLVEKKSEGKGESTSRERVLRRIDERRLRSLQKEIKKLRKEFQETADAETQADGLDDNEAAEAAERDEMYETASEGSSEETY